MERKQSLAGNLSSLTFEEREDEFLGQMTAYKPTEILSEDEGDIRDLEGYTDVNLGHKDRKAAPNNVCNILLK